MEQVIYRSPQGHVTRLKVARRVQNERSLQELHARKPELLVKSSSPSKQFMKVGEYMSSGVSEGFARMDKRMTYMTIAEDRIVAGRIRKARTTTTESRKFELNRIASIERKGRMKWKFRDHVTEKTSRYLEDHNYPYID